MCVLVFVCVCFYPPWPSRACSSELQPSSDCVGAASVSEQPGPDGAARQAGPLQTRAAWSVVRKGRWLCHWRRQCWARQTAVHPDSWSVAQSAPRPKIVGPLQALASPENNSDASSVTATPATQPSFLWVQGAIGVEVCKARVLATNRGRGHRATPRFLLPAMQTTKMTSYVYLFYVF